jgi:hypothetical protein
MTEARLMTVVCALRARLFSEARSARFFIIVVS